MLLAIRALRARDDHASHLQLRRVVFVAVAARSGVALASWLPAHQLCISVGRKLFAASVAVPAVVVRRYSPEASAVWTSPGHHSRRYQPLESRRHRQGGRADEAEQLRRRRRAADRKPGRQRDGIHPKSRDDWASWNRLELELRNSRAEAKPERRRATRQEWGEKACTLRAKNNSRSVFHTAAHQGQRALGESGALWRDCECASR